MGCQTVVTCRSARQSTLKDKEHHASQGAFRPWIHGQLLVMHVSLSLLCLQADGHLPAPSSPSPTTSTCLAPVFGNLRLLQEALVCLQSPANLPAQQPRRSTSCLQTLQLQTRLTLLQGLEVTCPLWKVMTPVNDSCLLKTPLDWKQTTP